MGIELFLTLKGLKTSFFFFNYILANERKISWSADSLPQCLQQLELGQAVIWSLELNGASHVDDRDPHI